MTDFRRSDARDLVVSILADSLPALNGRVFRSRVWPTMASDTPSALVYGWQETKTRKSLDMWTHQFEVSCAMAIWCRVQAATAADTEAAMEEMARDIEDAILTSPLLLGLTSTIERIDLVETKMEIHQAELLQGDVQMAFHLVWTEIHQAIVPTGEVITDKVSIHSFPTIY